MTNVYTSRVSYHGPDRLDITRMSAPPDGIAFAPSWLILRPMLQRRREDHVTETEWLAYAAAYTAEMRDSYRGHRARWDALLERDEVTLVCYCTDVTHCHRTVLAGILTKLGATPCGER